MSNYNIFTKGRNHMVKKLAKVAVGVVCGLIAAEATAIGANAAIDDCYYVGDQIKHMIEPEPVKRGLFGRIKKR